MLNAMVDKEPTQVKLCNIDGLAVGQLVPVLVKVMHLQQLQKVKIKDGKEPSMQECKFSDDSSCVRLVLWEEAVEEAGVRSYDGVKYLSVGANCMIEKKSDTGEVAEVD